MRPKPAPTSTSIRYRSSRSVPLLARKRQLRSFLLERISPTGRRTSKTNGRFHPKKSIDYHPSSSSKSTPAFIMGAAVSAFREQILSSEKANKEEIRQQLDFLVKATESKLDKYQSDIEDMFQDPDSVSRKQVPGIRALRFERGYRVSVSKSAAEGIGEVVDAFFGAANADDPKAAIVNGFKKVVGTALNAILGNDQAGQQEEQKFFVFMKNNAIVRIDIKMWRYNFSGKGVMAESENVFCYIFCLSVVDHYKLELDELTFLLSEYAGDEFVEAYIDYLVSLWGKIIAIPRSVGLATRERVEHGLARRAEITAE